MTLLAPWEQETFVKEDRGSNLGLKWAREQDPPDEFPCVAQLSRSRVEGESEREGEKESGTRDEGETEEAEDARGIRDDASCSRVRARLRTQGTAAAVAVMNHSH
jgi:hypothetical protein